MKMPNLKKIFVELIDFIFHSVLYIYLIFRITLIHILLRITDNFYLIDLTLDFYEILFTLFNILLFVYVFLYFCDVILHLI